MGADGNRHDEDDNNDDYDGDDGVSCGCCLDDDTGDAGVVDDGNGDDDGTEALPAAMASRMPESKTMVATTTTT